MAPSMAPSMALYRSVLESPIGPLTLVVSERGVRAIHFGNVPGPEGAQESETRSRGLAKQLREYFQKKRRDFELDLDWEGT
ncbi:MAG: hypothetical protein ACRD2D_14575, partial [Terriglobales bacterium]